MLLNYERYMEHREIVREVCKKYRKEVTINCGIIQNEYNICSYEETIKFLNQLSYDEFCAFFYTAIGVDEYITYYKQLLDDKITFIDIIENSNIYNIELFKEKMGI